MYIEFEKLDTKDLAMSAFLGKISEESAERMAWVIVGAIIVLIGSII